MTQLNHLSKTTTFAQLISVRISGNLVTIYGKEDGESLLQMNEGAGGIAKFR